MSNLKPPSFSLRDAQVKIQAAIINEATATTAEAELTQGSAMDKQLEGMMAMPQLLYRMWTHHREERILLQVSQLWEPAWTASHQNTLRKGPCSRQARLFYVTLSSYILLDLQAFTKGLQ